MNDYLYDLLGVRDRLIMDPVHGGITLFRHEVEVIDHPLFQRLRHICQNDILSWVFPGATHSRFLHSIGTLHVGGRMFQGLIEGALERFRALGILPLAAPHLEAIAHFGKLVRLACLLHDCGHSSFSHQFSQAAAIRGLLAQPGRFQRLWQGIDTRTLYDNPPDHLEHEHYSVRCAQEILGSLSSPILRDLGPDVLALMETTRCEATPLLRRQAAALWPILTGDTTVPEDAGELCLQLFRHLVSGEVDADRADYMLRDGFHSSVTLGGFNLDHLLKNIHVGWSPSERWLGLGITHKGLGALEDFVYSRYQMYRKVYGHKTSIGFDWLLRQAIDEVLADPEACSFIDACLGDMRRFQTLTDNYFWEAFRRHAEANPDSCAADLVYRRRLRHVASAENLSAEALEQTLQQWATHLKRPADALITCSLHARFSRIRPGFKAIRVIRESGRYSDITEVSSFFSKFGDQRLHHIYLHPRAA